MPVGCYRFLRASATPRGGATIALPFHGISWFGMDCGAVARHFHGLVWIVAPFHSNSWIEVGCGHD